jgi:zeaxanthin glucosyltransferase
MHFGVISPPVRGHLNPFGALGRELIARGHQVTVIHMEDVRAWALGQGLNFIAIGQADHPTGSLPLSLDALGKLKGFAALRFTIEAVRRTTEMFCRDAPEAVRQAGIGMLLVDQTEPAGGSVAEHLGLPFITVCNALLLNEEPCIPPPFSGWRFSTGLPARVRNRIGYSVAGRIMSPVTQVIRKYRRIWNLAPHRRRSDSFSPLAQLCQLPPAFDYPRSQLPSNFFYTGPLRRPEAREVAFPWDKLDGRPLIYGSLGTLQNGREPVFRCFAEACRSLDVQLVITHGGGLTDGQALALPGNPIVVSYAPQTDVLRRACLTLTHAGLNTVLDSLSCGVPLIAIPIAYEQPAIAARLAWTGAGRVIPFGRLNSELLKKETQKVLSNDGFVARAKEIARSITDAGGVGKAATLIEECAQRRSGEGQGNQPPPITSMN